MIKNESYVVLGGWMLNKLKLKGNELVAYATIYSFTNGTEDHCFKGSASYLAERCGIDKRSVLRILQKLEGKGYITRKERNENGIKFVDYYSVTNVIGGDKMSLGGSDKMSPHSTSFDNDSSQKNSNPKQNNGRGEKNSELDIIKNSDDIREVLSDEEIRQYKMQLKIILKMVELGYKVPKTKQDIEKEIEWLKAKAKLYGLIQGDGNIAWQTFYQKIDKRYDWHTEKGKPVKNFKTSIVPFISK